MEGFLQLAAAAGLGGLISSMLQYVLVNRRTFLEWRLKARNEAVLEFLDTLSGVDAGKKTRQDLVYASTKAKLFVGKPALEAIDAFLGFKEQGNKVAEKKVLDDLWHTIGEECSKPANRW